MGDGAGEMADGEALDLARRYRERIVDAGILARRVILYGSAAGAATRRLVCLP